MHTANRLQHWGIILLNYNFKIEFLSLKKLGHADGLSRLIPKFSEPLEDIVIAVLSDEEELSVLLCNTIWELPVTLEHIKRSNWEGWIHRKKWSSWYGWLKDRKKKEYPLFQFVSKYYYMQIVVMPYTLQKKILREFRIGHPGMSRLKSLMHSYANWLRMDKNIEKMVRV